MRTIYIRGDILASVWERSIRAILEKGTLKDTEYGMHAKTIKLLARVEDALMEPRISTASPFKERLVKKYVDEMLVVKEHDFDYMYSERLMAYPAIKDKFNQVEWAIEALNKNPITRRVTLITRIVPDDCIAKRADGTKKSTPCLTMLHFGVVENNLYMDVVFRSHDAWGAANANWYALGELAKKVVEGLDFDIHRVILDNYSCDYHIYEHDLEEAEETLMS